LNEQANLAGHSPSYTLTCCLKMATKKAVCPAICMRMCRVRGVNSVHGGA